MLQLKTLMILTALIINGVVSFDALSASIDNPLSSTKTITNSNLANKQATDISWLKLSSNVLKNYQYSISEHSPELMTVVPGWRKQPAELTKKILAVVSKRSSSYIQASNELLQMLKRNNIYAQVDFINFAKKIDIGKALLLKAESDGYDLIFSMGSESAGFIYKHYSGGRLPVVMSTCKDPVLLGQIANYEQGSGTNIAWTSLNVPVNIQKSYLYQLKPQLKNIGLMFNQAHKQVMTTEVIPAREEMKKWGIKVFNIAVNGKAHSRESLKKIIPEVISKMKQTDPELKNSLFWITSSTAIFSEIELINQLSGKIPVLAAIPNVVKQGDASAVLAIGIDRRNNAHLASIYAIKILKGEASPGQLKVGIVTPPDVAINFHIAKKIDLKIPFSYFENAAFIYDYEGKLVRNFGQKVSH